VILVMRHTLALFFILLGFGGFLVVQGASNSSAAGPHASLITIDGVIDPVSADFLARSIETAAKNDSQLVVVELDTPGGLLSSTRDMVETILAADIPVVVYVSPQGAQAASAGTFITASAHIAVMAPSTNIGAASPVGSGGEELPDTIKSKITEDTAAFIRSIAETRNRNAEALQQTVLSAKSYSASEALNANLIDLIAEDVPDLLAKLDGRSVSVHGSQVVLQTASLEVQNIQPTALERFLGFIANPNVAFILLTIGGIGILIELFSPGLVGPGAVGVIALALAFLALWNLPVNWVGVGLIILAMALFYVETQAPGIGIFGVSGAISFVLGAFLLFGGITPGRPEIPQPSFRVSLWLIGIISIAMFGSLVLMFRASRQAKKVPTYVPPSAVSLVNQIGTATTALSPRGTVRLAGETWSAISDDGETISRGEEVVVSEVEGLTLKVFKASEVKGQLL
jgi:membrane-bound serine protease (ClpP class)